MTSFDPPHEPDWGDDPEFDDAFANDAVDGPESPWPESSDLPEFDPVPPGELDLDPIVDGEVTDDGTGDEPAPGDPVADTGSTDDPAPDPADDDAPTIELGLDPDELDAPDPDALDAEGPDSDPSDDDTLGATLDDVDDPAWPEPAAGLLSHETLVSFAAIGGVEISTDDLAARMDDLGIAFDDHGLAARDAVRVLDELGLDALVEHGSIDDLAELLESGSQVVVGGSDPAGEALSLVLVGVDPGEEVVVLVDANGVRFEVSFDDFEEGWESSTNEILRAEGGPSAISIRLAADPFPVDLGLN